MRVIGIVDFDFYFKWVVVFFGVLFFVIECELIVVEMLVLLSEL